MRYRRCEQVGEICHAFYHGISSLALMPLVFLLVRSRNNLLNGDTTSYNWDSGYTCHQLGSGSILVQLGQPYMIDSMRYD